MLIKYLSRLAKEFVYERAKPFANSDFGNFIRRDLADVAKRQLTFLPYEYTVKASVGAGNWAAVPWLAYFDPLETNTATKGCYIVYLINAQTEEIFLSLNQGATQVYREFGENKGREILRRRAIDITDRVSEFAKFFDTNDIELGSMESLPQGYTAGHAFGRKYHPDFIDEDLFYQDLNRMFSAYECLVDRGGITPTDTMAKEVGGTHITETRKYFLSRRIERASNVRKKVLKLRNCRCEACDLDPEIHYGYSGLVENTPLDIHHLLPISGLSEGETKRYKVPQDFLVLCPTCHRMIHKQNDPSDLEELKLKISFSFNVETQG